MAALPSTGTPREGAHRRPGPPRGDPTPRTAAPRPSACTRPAAPKGSRLVSASQGPGPGPGGTSAVRQRGHRDHAARRASHEGVVPCDAGSCAFVRAYVLGRGTRSPASAWQVAGARGEQKRARPGPRGPGVRRLRVQILSGGCRVCLC